MRFAVAGPVTGHEIQIRDLRQRFGDPERYVAECSCGWVGEPRGAIFGERRAKRDGVEHVDQERRSRG